ncbi:MAG: Nif3-like dinuclear metal center hexameric protein [Candidatus Hydrogenedentes bacterium]|nr:Nif3-like dinuclear metal center hexameric protein [Candidatus Hydrogenedentota bacterium]
MKGINIRDIIRCLEEWAPMEYTLPDDNSGLQVGRIDKKAKKVLICLTLTNQIVEQAIKTKTDLVISHHPLIYKPLRTIAYEEYPSNLIIELVKNDIVCYSIHTNLDTAQNGVSYAVAKKLGLRDIKGLIPLENGKLFKLTTFVPKDYLEKVRTAVCEEGAGIIGEYSYCSFSTSGTGTFLPSEKASPFTGTTGKINEEKEERFEVIVPVHKLSRVIDALLESHPYEEVAYDIYPLYNKNNKISLGVRGNLEEPTTVEEFSKFVKSKLSVPQIRIAGIMDKEIRTVGIIGGSGGGEIKKIINCVDLLITGDLKYHQAIESIEMGFTVIDAGHFYTEYPVVEEIKIYLTQKFPLLEVETFPEIEPFHYI